MKYALLKHFWL